MLVAFLFVYITFLAAIGFTMRTAQNPNGDILLGVSLSAAHRETEIVSTLCKAYSAACHRVLLLFAFLMLPGLLFYRYSSITMIYLFVYICALLFACERVLRKYNRTLMEIKQKNGWTCGKQVYVCADTELARLKQTFPVKKIWFAISGIISVAFTLNFALLPVMMQWNLPNFASLGVWLFCFAMYHVVCHSRNRIYSENAEINLALNHVYQHEWTRVFAILSYAGLPAGIYVAVCYRGASLVTASIVYGVAVSLLTCMPMLGAFLKVRNLRNRLNAQSDAAYMTDEDAFWRGSVYRNPNDARLFVEKRIGIGLTTNEAHPAARVFNGVITLVIVGCLLLAVSMIPYDFAPIALSCDGDVLTASALWKDRTILRDEILQAELLETLPRMSKIDGMSAEQMRAGTFYLPDYGNAEVFVRPKLPPFLMLRLQDDRLFLLGSDEAEQVKEAYAFCTAKPQK